MWRAETIHGRIKWLCWGITALAVLAVAAVLLLIPEPEPQAAPAETRPSVSAAETYLVMGLDKFQAPEDAIGYLNDQQADFLMLLVVRDNSCRLLHLNRDTMTEITRLGVGGGAAGKFTGQLALAHTYGSGGSDSCLNTMKAVSTLLQGQKIDHYLAMTMEAVGRINDLVGGVTVTVMDDMTAVDPELQKGREVTLQGRQALQYVRTRGGLENSTNLRRMERQRQYIEALYGQLLQVLEQQEDFPQKLLSRVNDSFQSDLSLPQLTELLDRLPELTVEPISTMPGETVKGEEFMEFYPEPGALEQLVSELFP